MQKWNKLIKAATGVLIGALCFGGNVYAEELEHPKNPEIMGQNVRELEIVKDGETTLHIVYEPQEHKNYYTYWTIRTPYEDAVFVDTEVLYEYFGNFDLLKLNEANAKEDAEIPEEIDTEIRVAWFTEVQEEKESIYTLADSEMTLKIFEEDGQCKGIVDGYEEVYELDQSLIKTLTEVDPSEFLLNLTHVVDVNKIDSFSAETPNGKVSLEKDDQEWILDGEAAEEEAAHQVYMDFMGFLAAGEISDEIEEEDRTAALTLTYVYTDDIAENVVVNYYEYDEEHYSVNVNGHEFFKVLKEDVDAITEKYNI